MTTTPQMDTMRTKVLDALLALFPQKDTPEGKAFMEEYGVGWSVSTREPLGQLPKGKISSIGVYGGNGDRKPDFPFTDVTMPSVIEVKLAKENGTQVAVTAERYLGVVERVLKAAQGDLRSRGLIYEISVTSDSVDIDGPYSEQVEGALYFDIRFSQNTSDPRQGR